MGGDHVLLGFTDFKITPGVVKSFLRMGKAVPPVGSILLVPVIEKVVMQESTSHESMLIHMHMERVYNSKACEGNGNGMGINRGAAVLDECF